MITTTSIRRRADGQRVLLRVYCDDLRAARLAAGLSLADVAVLCGVTRQAVHLWEQGRASPSLEHIQAVRAEIGNTWQTQETI